MHCVAEGATQDLSRHSVHLSNNILEFNPAEFPSHPFYSNCSPKEGDKHCLDCAIPVSEHIRMMGSLASRMTLLAPISYHAESFTLQGLKTLDELQALVGARAEPVVVRLPLPGFRSHGSRRLRVLTLGSTITQVSRDLLWALRESCTLKLSWKLALRVTNQRAIAPKFEALALEYGCKESGSFGQIDEDEAVEMSKVHSIRARPTLVVLKAGGHVEVLKGSATAP